MQTYAEFTPTGFDRAGAFLPESMQSYLVLPCSINRDSDCLAQSNFAAALKMLGGESDMVQVHRFGHWACGWFEIILVNPFCDAAAIAQDIEASLADYPVLDEEDMSAREYDAYTDAWHSYGWREFADGLADKFGSEVAEAKWDLQDALRDCSIERLQTAFESLIPSGEYYDHDGAPNVRYAVDNATRTDVDMLLRSDGAP